VKRLASLHLDDHNILLNSCVMASSRGLLEEQIVPLMKWKDTLGVSLVVVGQVNV
jgi:hypothetical protein